MTADEPDVIAMCERYSRLYAASVFDVLDEMGLPGQCLSLAIRPLDPNWVVAGVAFTLKRTAESRHPVEVMKERPGSPNIFSIVDGFRPGHVLVMETGKSMIGAGHLLLQGQYLARNRIYAGIETALLDIQGHRAARVPAAGRGRPERGVG